MTIICLHGVGLWPGLFDGLGLGAAAMAPTRPGYDSRPATDLAGNVAAVASIVADTDGAVLVGVSGGATIALACALHDVEGVVAVVTHEPLVGALEPGIDARVSAWAAELDTTPGAEPSLRFLEGLYGRSSWRQMPPEAAAWAHDHADTVCHEVPHFAAFQPSIEDLDDLAIPHLTTVGECSPPARHRVAALLGRGGSQVAVIEQSGHHVLVDQPVALAARVRAFIADVL